MDGRILICTSCLVIFIGSITLGLLIDNTLFQLIMMLPILFSVVLGFAIFTDLLVDTLKEKGFL